MTQFCYVSSDEGEVLSENTGSPSKVLRLALTDIAGPSESKHVTSTQESQEYSDESDCKSQLRGTKHQESLIRRSKRIRHSYNTQEVRQTPMGLPKPLRLSKKEFTIEEIYLNKNYRTPPEKNLETIFEFPKEHRDGTIMTHAKTRKKRKCVFSIDFNKKTAKGKKRKGFKRKRLNIEGNADEVLKQKLSSLDNALALANLSP